MESFWARLQVELLNTRRWATTIELTAAMADYIDNFYNAERRHSYLGNISPAECLRHSGRPPIQSLNSHDHGSKRRV
ncbi:IS3 family transposase [Mycobacterium sp. SMC-4]|uniref:IS3 family transposase n=1 Tax=Mycobacterium sp. SMC-4 TaxID=2857059 RepID=UPI003D07931B